MSRTRTRSSPSVTGGVEGASRHDSVVFVTAHELILQSMRTNRCYIKNMFLACRSLIYLILFNFLSLLCYQQ